MHCSEQGVEASNTYLLRQLNHLQVARTQAVVRVDRPEESPVILNRTFFLLPLFDFGDVLSMNASSQCLHTSVTQEYHC